jgi:hypothetical protein
MKISELPEDVQKKALNYQNQQGDFNDEKSDSLAAAFDWKKTNEGFEYWEEWFLKEDKKPFNYFETATNPYVKNNYDENGVTKPKQYQIGIDTFERAEANLTKEQILAICKFNIDKYNWRQKEQDKEDFKKIIDYANWAIKNL